MKGEREGKEEQRYDKEEVERSKLGGISGSSKCFWQSPCKVLHLLVLAVVVLYHLPQFPHKMRPI